MLDKCEIFEISYLSVDGEFFSLPVKKTMVPPLPAHSHGLNCWISCQTNSLAGVTCSCKANFSCWIVGNGIQRIFTEAYQGLLNDRPINLWSF